ncbi:hypothetical protein [Flavobacterium granuli]|uniref:Uncharacterized protein n=1 Tax=Flavobacterium granuli TaxID=280093 RepID=A0ABU1S3L7_9FLAO|nr:hypothetical protein [Flavobacterium granuli]MDR6845590.1 hypothetical protein [Flavobacterium granuli]
MHKYLEIFKSNLTVITLIFYVLGYTYLAMYYFQFDISIVNYINLQDILFTAINSLVVLILTYLFVEFGLYIIGIFILNTIFQIFIKRKFLKKLGNNPRVQKYLKFRNEKYYSANIEGTTLFLLVLITFLLLYFSDEKALIFSLFIPFFIIKLYRITPKEKGEMQIQLNQFFLGLLTFTFILCFAYWGYKDGTTTKNSKNGQQIEFREQGIAYNTKSDSLNFIGETNEYLFLYNNKNRETLIFSKSGINCLKIKDTSPTNDEKKAQEIEAQRKMNDFFEKIKQK